MNTYRFYMINDVCHFGIGVIAFDWIVIDSVCDLFIQSKKLIGITYIVLIEIGIFQSGQVFR